MLRYEAKKRGTTRTADGTLLCFAKIREILNMQIVHVFHVLEGKDISYVCQPGDTLFTLKMYLHQEVGVELQNQLLLFSDSGTVLPDEHQLDKCCSSVFYLFNKSRNARSNISSHLPDKVRELVGDPEVMHKCSELRLYWAQASYYCQKKSSDYSRLLQSQDTLLQGLDRKRSGMQKLKEQLQLAAGELRTVIDMFTLSLDSDYVSYSQHQFGDAGKQLLDEWHTLSYNVDALREYTKIDALLNKMENIQGEFDALQKSPLIAGQKMTAGGGGGGQRKNNALDEM